MITAIKSRNSRQFEWALWTPRGKNAEKSKPRWIQFERLSDRTNIFSATGGNIVTPSRTITIKTGYQENFERNDWIKWRDKVYTITTIKETIEDEPQALKWVKPEYQNSHILELMEIDTGYYIEN